MPAAGLWWATVPELGFWGAHILNMGKWIASGIRNVGFCTLILLKPGICSGPQLVRSQLGTVAAISMPAAAAARMEAIFIYFLWDSKSHRPISSKSSKSLHKKSRKSERRGSPRRSSSTDHLRTRAPLEIVGST